MGNTNKFQNTQQLTLHERVIKSRKLREELQKRGIICDVWIREGDRLYYIVLSIQYRMGIPDEEFDLSPEIQLNFNKLNSILEESDIDIVQEECILALGPWSWS